MGETLALQHVAPAHTDTDIYVHFQKAGNYTRLFRARRARQQSGSREIPGHAHRFARARSEIDSRGEIAQEAVAGKAVADLDSVWGNGILTATSGPRRLSDALSLRLVLALTDDAAVCLSGNPQTGANRG